jgi:hypothetical protein
MIFCNKNFIGKSTWLWVTLLFFFLVACPTDNKEEQNETTLTISNNSSSDLVSCSWNGTQFGTRDPYYYRDNDRHINHGEKSTENVDPGSGYIFFEFPQGWKSGRSQELIILEKGESKTFVFLDSTVVVDQNGKTYTLIDY